MTKATTILSNSHQNKQSKRSRPVRDYGDGDDDNDDYYYTYYNIVVRNKHLLPTPGSMTRIIDRKDVEEVIESLTTATIRTNKNCKKCPPPDDVHYCATLGVSFWGNDVDEDNKELYKKKNLNQVVASGRILDQDTLRVSQIKQNNDNNHHQTINRHSNNKRRPWTNHAKRFLTSYQPPSE